MTYLQIYSLICYAEHCNRKKMDLELKSMQWMCSFSVGLQISCRYFFEYIIDSLQCCNQLKCQLWCTGLSLLGHSEIIFFLPKTSHGLDRVCLLHMLLNGRLSKLHIGGGREQMQSGSTLTVGTSKQIIIICNYYYSDVKKKIFTGPCTK